MWGWFPLTIIPATSRREVIIINPDVNLYIWQPGHWWMCWSFSHIAMCFSPTSSLHPWQPRGSDTFLGHREMGGSCSKSSISRRDFWCLSQEVWPVHGKITCKEWDQPARVVSKNPWIGFLGKILTGNPWVLPSNVGVSWKCSLQFCEKRKCSAYYRSGHQKRYPCCQWSCCNRWCKWSPIAATRQHLWDSQ